MKVLVLLAAVFSMALFSCCQKQQYGKDFYYPCRSIEFGPTMDTIISCPSSDGYNCPDSIFLYLKVRNGGKATVSFLINDQDDPIVQVVDSCVSLGNGEFYINIQDKKYHIRSTVPISGRIVIVFYTH